MSIHSPLRSSSTLTPPNYPHTPLYYSGGYHSPLFPLPQVDFSQPLPAETEQLLLKADPGTYHLEKQDGLVKVFYVFESISSFPTSPPSYTSHPQKEIRQVAFRHLNSFDWEVVLPNPNPSWSNQSRAPQAFSSWEQCLEAEGQNLLKMPLDQYLQQTNRAQLINIKHFVPSMSLAHAILVNPQIPAGSYLFTSDVLDINTFYLMFARATPYVTQNKAINQLKIEITTQGHLVLKNENNIEIKTFSSFEHLLNETKQVLNLTNPPNLSAVHRFAVRNELLHSVSAPQFFPR